MLWELKGQIVVRQKRWFNVLADSIQRYNLLNLDVCVGKHWCIFFFFQAEDGIRDIGVTGVQTCALPISSADGFPLTTLRAASRPRVRPPSVGPRPSCRSLLSRRRSSSRAFTSRSREQIGRASCRERV